MSFQFKDLTEEFFEKIVLFYFIKPNAHMDTAGGAIMVAEDGTVYLIDACYDGTGFELPYRDFPKLFPFPSNEEFPQHEEDNEKTDKTQWKYLEGCTVRSDIYDDLKRYIEDKRACGHRASPWQSVVELLGFDYKQARQNEVVYQKSLEARARHKREREEEAAHRWKVRLREEDVQWEEISSSSRIEGYRLRLARKYGDSISAKVYYIEVQRPIQRNNSEAEGEGNPEIYNLFVHYWNKVVDPIELKEGLRAWEDRGLFCESYLRLEDAKAGALERCDVNRENRIDEEKVFTTHERKFILTADEKAERNLNEAERLTKRFMECYFDAKRYLLRTEKLRDDLSEANVCWLDAVWNELNEAVAHVVKGDDPMGV